MATYTEPAEDSLMMSMGQSIRNNIGQYQIVQTLSRGGSGFVLKIRQRKKKTQYALKVITKPPANSKLQSKIKSRVDNQIQIHKQLNESPHVIRFRTTFEDHEYYYIVLELCEAGDMAQYLKTKTKLSPADLKDFTLQIISGLQYIHSKNIIHRDIKPSNILISNNNTVKICDFGLAMRREGFGESVGTLNYCSPEILDGKKKYDCEVDMWSLGCTLYYMVTGEHLWSFGKRAEAIEHFWKKEVEIEFPVGCDKGYEMLVRRLVVKNPKERLTLQTILCTPMFLQPTIVVASCMTTPPSFPPSSPPTKPKSLSPLKTLHLPSTTLQLQSGSIIIDQNGITKPSCSAHPFDFKINQPGTLITIKKSKQQKSYPLSDLPEKYHLLYGYCKNIVEILEDREMKSVLKNERGIFKVFRGGGFVASFVNGKTVYLEEGEKENGGVGKKGEGEKQKQKETEEGVMARKYFKVMKELS